VTGRRVIGPAVVLLALAGCGTSVGAGAAASCVGPQPTLVPTTAAPGDRMSLSVQYLHSGCRDTNPSDEVEKPLLHVRVEVVQGSARGVVGTVSGTGEHFSGALSFALPSWLRPGPAEVVLGAPVPDRLPFTVVPAS
jgi:hypothetical protein